MAERIAKIIARSGICSRRDAEKLIADGRVKYKKELVLNPAMKFEDTVGILVDGKPIAIQKAKLWLYHKPVGLVVSHKDEENKKTIFDTLPIEERVISVGRLDKNTSGLLLLTNDGELARRFELPSNNFIRIYKVRVHGVLNFNKFKNFVSKAFEIEGVHYRPMGVELESSSGMNHWLKLSITEGKNREIRKIIACFDLKIAKLIRVQYGEFKLGMLKEGQVTQVSLN